MTKTLRLEAIREMGKHLEAVQALSLMLQQVPDEFLDREMKDTRINHASMWDRDRPYVSCYFTPLDEDQTFSVDVYNAQRSSWDRERKIEKRRSTVAGRIQESFSPTAVFGCLWPLVQRTLGSADCRKALVTQEIEVCGDVDESKYVKVQYID